MEQFNTSTSYISVVAAVNVSVCVVSITAVYAIIEDCKRDGRHLLKYGLMKFFYSQIFKTFVPTQFNRYCHIFLVVFISIFSINLYGLFTYCFTLTGCLLFTATVAFTFMF